jgi:hypothetical protein
MISNNLFQNLLRIYKPKKIYRCMKTWFRKKHLKLMNKEVAQNPQLDHGYRACCTMHIGISDLQMEVTHML